MLQTKLDYIIRKMADLFNENDDLRNLIVSYVILKSGIVQPTDSNVSEVSGFRWLEAFDCFPSSSTSSNASSLLDTVISVFPAEKMEKFTELGTEDKLLALNELSDIVTGLMLFHKECGLGGTGIENCMLLLLFYIVCAADLRMLVF